MAKTNAERQREYRERKKAQSGSTYLEKERKRQKKYYVKAKDLSKKELEKKTRRYKNASEKAPPIS